MSDWIYESCEPALDDRPSFPRKVFVRAIPSLAAFSFSAAVALRLAGGLMSQANAPQPELARAPAKPAVALPHVDLASGDAKPDLGKPRNPFGGLFDPNGETQGMPAAMQAARTDPIGPSFSPLQAQPLFAEIETPDSGSQFAEDEASQPAAQAETADNADGVRLKPALPPVETAEAEQPQAVEQVVATTAEAAAAAPLPPVRPAQLAALSRDAAEEASREAPALAPRKDAAGPTRAAAAARDRAQAATLARNDPRSFFDKIFNNNDQQPKGPQLAYAPSDGGGSLFGLGHSFPSSPGPGEARGGTAVYDISAHTVYLPNGERLEAHSGLGPYFDDPGHVHVRMRGSTPPATYRLTLRESLFHGVQALRLTPVSGTTYGRGGLLAHTFMLGQRGDSNGCVSFRNYRAFLEAYRRGEIRELRVVASR
jgi:hypothetical protein